MNEPMTFEEWGIVTLTLPSKGHEGWIFYIFGLAIKSVGMTERRSWQGATGAPEQLVIIINTLSCACLTDWLTDWLTNGFN